MLNIRPQASYQALLQARTRQQTKEFAGQYATRAGVEVALSQEIRSFGLRRCRYIGEPKARLQHLMTAVAINLVRVVAWKADTPLGYTRPSPFAQLLLTG
jgi:transposase